MIIEKKTLILILAAILALAAMITILVMAYPSGKENLGDGGAIGTASPMQTAALQIESATITGRQAGALRFPDVQLDDAAVAAKINGAVKNLIDFYKTSLNSGNLEKLDFETTYNKNGILSLLFTGISKNGQTQTPFYVPMTFDLSLGEALASGDIFPTAAWEEQAFVEMINAGLKEQGYTPILSLSPTTTGVYLSENIKTSEMLYHFILSPDATGVPAIVNLSESQLAKVPVPLS